MSSKQKGVQQTGPAKPTRPPWLWPALAAAAVLVIVAALVWLVQGGQVGAGYTPEVTGGPSAQIDQTVFDYGDVKLGTTIKTVFRVKNVGDAQLAFRSNPRVEVLEGC